MTYFVSADKCETILRVFDITVDKLKCIKIRWLGIAISYGLDVSGIESRWGRDLPHLSRPAVGLTQPPEKWVRGSFHGGKAAGAWR